MNRLLYALKAIAEPTRLRLLAILVRNELTVSEITYVLDQSQPRISRHLKLMCDSGLLNRTQEGAWVFYRLTDSPFGRRLSEALLELIPENDPVICHDIKRLEQVCANHLNQAKLYFHSNAKNWDKLRSLHVEEKQIEQAMLNAVEGMQIDELLDMGTGTGRILEVFSGVIKRGMGVDINREMLAIARAKLEELKLTHCQVRQGDIHHLVLAQDRFDLITIHHVLHYLNDPAMVINEAARLLRPGGKLLLVDFAPHAMESLREEHTHRRLGFSDQEIQVWCKSAGLQVVDVKHLEKIASNDSQLSVTLWVLKK